MKDRARSFRKSRTIAEDKMWYYLRGRRLNGYKFLREYEIEFYIVDFICRSKKLIIEIDGGQHGEDENIEYDKKRTARLEELGYRVIRFWNNEVMSNVTGVLETILTHLDKDFPSPAPRERGQG